MNIEDRNRLINILYTEKDLSMEQIGCQFGISRNRVKQILAELGINVKAVREQRMEKRLNKMKSLIERDPAIPASKLAEALGIPLKQVRKILDYGGIKRDKKIIYSKAKTESKRKGRVELTAELLFQLYSIEKNSLAEIAEKLNYRTSTIAFNLKRFGIELRRSGPNNRS